MSSNTNLVKYEPWTPDEIDDEIAEIATESDYLKLAVGSTVLRVLPKRPGTQARSPMVKTWQHYLDIPGLSNAISFNCPRLMARRPCRACTRSDELRATGNPADFELSKQFKASMRLYANVILRASEERGPVIFPFGKMIRDDLMAMAHDPNWGDFTDPGPDGYDITITRTGTGQTDTRYKTLGARECAPLSDDAAQVEEWLSMMHDLDRFLYVPTDEEIEAMLPSVLVNPPPARGSSSGGTRGRRQRSRRAQDDIEGGE
jgi:hypothetical protein